MQLLCFSYRATSPRRLRDVSRSFPFLALKLRSMRRRCPCDWWCSSGVKGWNMLESQGLSEFGCGFISCVLSWNISYYNYIYIGIYFCYKAVSCFHADDSLVKDFLWLAPITPSGSTKRTTTLQGGLQWERTQMTSIFPHMSGRGHQWTSRTSTLKEFRSRLSRFGWILNRCDPPWPGRIASWLRERSVAPKWWPASRARQWEMGMGGMGDPEVI